MDPVVYAVIISIIAALAAFLGAYDGQKEKTLPGQVPSSVQIICASSPEECPPAVDAGRVHAVEGDAVLPSSPGYPDPEREDLLR